MARGHKSKRSRKEKAITGRPWGCQVASHICDPAPVPGHRLGFQCRLFHPLTKGLELILRIQDEEAGVLGGPLEEGYVWAQPSVKTEQERTVTQRGIFRHPTSTLLPDAPASPKPLVCVCVFFN